MKFVQPAWCADVACPLYNQATNNDLVVFKTLEISSRSSI